MKNFIIKSKSHWFRSLLAITLVAFAGFFLTNASGKQQRFALAASVAEGSATSIAAATSAITFSTPLELTGHPPSPAFFQADAEPEIKTDIFGNIYVTAIQGVPGGTDFWKSINRGATFVYMGQPDGAQDHCSPPVVQCVAVGGGDDSIDVSSDGYLYISSLWLGSVTMSTSLDGGTGGALPGQAWQVNPAAATIPGDDRQWVAAYDTETVYMSYTDIPTGVIDFEKSTDAGQTFSAPVQTYSATGTLFSDVQGNLAVDKYNGHVCSAFVQLGASNNIYLNRSLDGGTTWQQKLAYSGPAGSDNRAVFPMTAVDRGGNVHIAFSNCGAGHTNCQVYLVSSPDFGDTWSAAHQVSNPAADTNTTTAVQATIAAGSPGYVDIAWLGSKETTPDACPNKWRVFFAQTPNAMAATPTFTQIEAETDVMHDKDICFGGLSCGAAPSACNGNRDMLEYFSMALDADGNANIAYADSVNSCPPGTCRSNTWFIKQTGGPSVYAPPAAPAPATFAANLNVTGSGGAAEPSIKVDSHNCIYGSAPGTYFFASENAGVSFRDFTVPPVILGGDEDVATIPQQTGARNDALYYADLALADIDIWKSTDRGITWTSPGTGGVAGNFNPSSDRQWIAGDRINGGANQILWELDHEFTTEAIRISCSIDDSPWGTTSGLVAPELANTTENTNPGNVFVDKSTHTMHGVFAGSTITTNAMDPPYGKEPNYWEVVATAPPAGGLPPINVANYAIFRGLIDSPTTALAGTTTYGSHVAAIFPAGAADNAGNIYAVWTTLSARPNATIGANPATTWDIWFASSHDAGKTFYGPFKISSGTGTSIFPWIDAGTAGRVDIVWYQSSSPAPPLVSDPSSPGQLTGGPNSMPGATWNVMFAQSLNANSREPVFAVTTASDHIIHTGSISIGGLTGSADRSLLDYFEVAIGPDGLANIMSADNGTSGLHINYMRQNSGPLAVTNPSAVTCLPIPPVASVVSRKVHGGAGTGDIPLPLTGTRGVECRSPGQTGTVGVDYKVVFTFVNNITNCGTAGTTGGSVVSGPNVNQCTENLTGIPDAQYTTVTLNGVADVAGNSGPVSAVMGLLVGDVNASGIVTSGDTNLCKAQALQPITFGPTGNFRNDINASGAITTGDVNIIKGDALHQLPTPP